MQIQVHEERHLRSVQTVHSEVARCSKSAAVDAVVAVSLGRHQQTARWHLHTHADIAGRNHCCRKGML